MEPGKWAPPVNCGWCRQITPSLAGRCIHCDGRLALAWAAPVLVLGHLLASLARCTLVVAAGFALLTLLFHVSFVVLLLPVGAVFMPRSNAHRGPGT